jgi:hypothetical protein
LKNAKLHVCEPGSLFNRVSDSGWLKLTPVESQDECFTGFTQLRQAINDGFTLPLSPSETAGWGTVIRILRVTDFESCK